MSELVNDASYAKGFADGQCFGEELGALDCRAHADHLAAMHEQLKCSCNYDRKGDVCGWHSEIKRAAFIAGFQDMRTRAIERLESAWFNSRTGNLFEPNTYEHIIKLVRALHCPEELE